MRSRRNVFGARGIGSSSGPRTLGCVAVLLEISPGPGGEGPDSHHSSAPVALSPDVSFFPSLEVCERVAVVGPDDLSLLLARSHTLLLIPNPSLSILAGGTLPSWAEASRFTPGSSSPHLPPQAVFCERCVELDPTPS